MTTFFTSDHHFGHAKIIDYCNRPWDDVDSMAQGMIDRWNETVEDDDVVYVLGDFAMGELQFTLPIVGQLAGTKHLIAGNHDRCWAGAMSEKRSAGWFQARCEMYMNAGFDTLSIDSRQIIAECQGVWRNVLLNHFPHRATGKCHDCMGEGHVAEDSMSVVGIPGGFMPVRCEACGGTGKAPDVYGKWRITPAADQLLLCGHVHDAWRVLDGKAVNVGVDVWDYRPVTLDEILLALKHDQVEYGVEELEDVRA